MAVSSVYTLSEAEYFLEQYKNAEKEIISSAAQSYKIGSREVVSLKLKEIREGIAYWSNMIDQINGTVRTQKSYAVVFRDL